MKPMVPDRPALDVTPTSIGDALASASARLPGESPTLDAQVLLGHVLKQPRAWLLAHADERLTAEGAAQFEALVRRCQAGEALPHVIGHWEFFGLDFVVTPEALIPRPETELLVEKTLGWMQSALPTRGRQRIVDVGAGSGCIAVTLAFFWPTAAVTAVDISEAALAVARANAERHGVEHRVDFRHGSLLEPVAGPVNVLCANLPYIPTAALSHLPVAKSEPRAALDGGPDGLRWIRALLAQAPAKMGSPGFVALEIEARQGAAALELARQAFPPATVELHRDLAGLDRLVTIELA